MNELSYKELPVFSFTNIVDLHEWFEKNYTRTEGIWIRYYKKSTNKPTILHTQAIDEALCWGWIDGLGNKYDDESWVVRFTPRRGKSVWSQINVAKVEILIATGRMRPSGLKHIESAKDDGRWDSAYASPTTMSVPDEFITLVQTDPATWEFYQSLNKANKYAFAYRIAVVVDKEKKDTKMQQLFAKLKRGEKFY